MAQVCIAMLTGYILKVPKIHTPPCKCAEVILMVSLVEEFHCSPKSVALQLVFWESPIAPSSVDNPGLLISYPTTSSPLSMIE